MTLIICRWCLGDGMVGTEICQQCEGQCCYHVVDSAVEPDDTTVPCACPQCSPSHPYNLSTGSAPSDEVKP